MIKEILNLEEASELFGVSIKTFIKLLKEEKVPARKIGREWRFSSKALIEWLSCGDSQFYSSSERDSKDFFNEVAGNWGIISKELYDESIKNKLFEYNILDKSKVIMDIGAGEGYFSLTVSEHVKDVIAVDISGEMIKQLKQKSKNKNIKNIKFVESDGLSIPYENCSIDLICSNMYLHHIENPILALKEMNRLLKDDGKIFLSDYLEHNNKRLIEEMHDIWSGFSKKKIEYYLRESGFENISYEILENKSKNSVSIFIIVAKKKK